MCTLKPLGITHGRMDLANNNVRGIELDDIATILDVLRPVPRVLHEMNYRVQIETHGSVSLSRDAHACSCVRKSRGSVR